MADLMIYVSSRAKSLQDPENNFYFGFTNDRTQYCTDWSCVTMDELFTLPELVGMAAKKD